MPLNFNVGRILHTVLNTSLAPGSYSLLNADLNRDWTMGLIIIKVKWCSKFKLFMTYFYLSKGDIYFAGVFAKEEFTKTCIKYEIEVGNRKMIFVIRISSFYNERKI